MRLMRGARVGLTYIPSLFNFLPFFAPSSMPPLAHASGGMELEAPVLWWHVHIQSYHLIVCKNMPPFRAPEFMQTHHTCIHHDASMHACIMMHHQACMHHDDARIAHVNGEA
jgi:hypothetical protein